MTISVLDTPFLLLLLYFWAVREIMQAEGHKEGKIVHREMLLSL